MPRRVETTSNGAASNLTVSCGLQSGLEKGTHALTYHEISKMRSSFAYTLTLHQLEEHLNIVSRICRWGQSGVQPSATVTFDDGHVSNFEYALPLLEQYSICAIFFVVAGFVNCRPDCMTWEHLREMSALGHEIQSHTWSHPLLTHCSDAELREELVRSKETIELLVGKPVEALGVPGGRWNHRVLRAAASAGYRRVYVSDPWVVNPQPENISLVGRLTVKNGLRAEQLRSLLTGEGMYPVFFRAGYRMKELFRSAVGDAAYKRAWSSISNARRNDVTSLVGNSPRKL